MIFYNKTTLLPSLDELYILFIQARIIKTNCFFCVGTRFAIEHKSKNSRHSIRIWKTQSIFNYCYGGLTAPGSVFIAALDYTVDHNNRYVKIDYLSINDGEQGNVYNDYSLDPATAQELVENLVNFIQIIAKTHHIAKITLDVHHNLLVYKKYYKNNGFELTGRKCADNPFWFETEKYV